MKNKSVTNNIIEALRYFGPLNATGIKAKLALRGINPNLGTLSDALTQLKAEKRIRVGIQASCQADAPVFVVCNGGAL